MNPKIWIVVAGLAGAVGVSIGAYHAHGLEKSLEKQTEDAIELNSRMENCATAVRYQMFHVPALLAVGLIGLHGGRRSLHAAGSLFALGMIGFSGGLYLQVFTGSFIHWSIVPAGGLFFIAGWVALAITGLTIPRICQGTLQE